MNSEIRLTVNFAIFYEKLILKLSWRSWTQGKVVMVREQRGTRDVTDDDTYGDI